MITIYEIGVDSYWTGATAEIADDAGSPRGWTRAAPPTLSTGELAKWNLGWVAVPVSDRLEAKKADKRAAVSALLDAKLSGGYPHDFGEPYGTKVLQTRDIEDRTNWLTSQASYSAAVAIGAGAIIGAHFRTEDNINIDLSYSDGLDVLLAMAAWGSGKYVKSWALKDAIAAAADEAALEAIDIESGW